MAPSRPVVHILGKWNFPCLYGSREREEFPYWAFTGQTGNISSRMLCLLEASFLSSALILQTHRHPSDVLSLSSLHPSSSDDPRAPFLFLHLFVRSLIFSLLVPAVARDPGQSDRVHRFDACFGCGLSRREGQGGVGEGAGGDEEEGPQTHRDGKTKSN